MRKDEGGGKRREEEGGRRRKEEEHGQKVKHSRVLPLLLETEPETCKVKLASKYFTAGLYES